MHGYLAVSCCPPRFLPQWTGIPHRKQAPGGFEPDALIKAALAALKSLTSVFDPAPLSSYLLLRGDWHISLKGQLRSSEVLLLMIIELAVLHYVL